MVFVQVEEARRPFKPAKAQAIDAPIRMLGALHVLSLRKLTPCGGAENLPQQSRPVDGQQPR
jgi:hypothetical protein